jgi:hypothetical protein
MMLLERGPQNGVVCNRITPEQIRERLKLVPQHFLRELEVIQLSQMTRMDASRLGRLMDSPAAAARGVGIASGGTTSRPGTEVT